jgi:hypothetical protein
MSAAAMFAPGGEGWHGHPHSLARLPKSIYPAASKLWDCLLELLPAGKTELGIEVTDAVLSKLSDYCERSVQEALYTLEHEIGWIDRIRTGGRRVISFIKRLAGRRREEPEPVRPGPPPRPAVPVPAVVPRASPPPPEAEPDPQAAAEELRRTKGWWTGSRGRMEGLAEKKRRRGDRFEADRIKRDLASCPVPPDAAPEETPAGPEVPAQGSGA